MNATETETPAYRTTDSRSSKDLAEPVQTSSQAPLVGVSLEFTHETLDSSEKRRALTNLIYDESLLGLGTTRSLAAQFVNLAWADAQGQPMVPSLRKWFSDRRTLMAGLRSIEADQATALADQERVISLQTTKAHAEKELKRLEGFREEISGVLISDGRYLNATSSILNLVEFGKYRAGVREAVALLDEILIPEAKERIAKADSKLTAALAA